MATSFLKLGDRFFLLYTLLGAQVNRPRKKARSFWETRFLFIMSVLAYTSSKTAISAASPRRGPSFVTLV